MVRMEDGSLGVHEVYVNDGKIIALTVEPIDLANFEDEADLKGTIELLYKDLVESDREPLNYEDHA